MVTAMRNILMSSCLGLWTLASLSGCGGGSGLVPDGGGSGAGGSGAGGSGGACGNTPACGGAIVGKWSVTSSCVSADAASMFSMNCPTETASASGVAIKGTVTYNADLTYATNTTTSGNIVVNVPASCSSPDAGTVTCDQLTQALKGATAMMYQSIACVGAGSGCSCTFVLVDHASTETGTYSTTPAGLLTKTATGGTPDESDYCVKGKTLTVSTHTGSGMAGQASIAGTITLTKQ